MLDRLLTEAKDRWQLLVLAAVIVVLAAITLIFSSPIAGAASVLVTGGLGLYYNRAAHSPPRPEVNLVAVGEPRLNPSELVTEIFERAAADGEEKSAARRFQPAPITVGRRRPLDVEAVVSDGIQRAHKQAPGRGPMASLTAAISPLMQAKPTDRDFREFEAEVDSYGERLRSWVAEVDEYLTERSAILLLEAHLANPAKLDAEDARVVVRFPPGFGLPEELPEAPEPPKSPTFPYRPSPLQRMVASTSGYSFSPSPISSAGHLKPLRMRKQQRNPRYGLLSSGELEADYPRHTIHHGESATAGGPMIVVASDPGEHRIAWEIHAKNLPRARQGFVTVTCDNNRVVGEPIQTLGDLEAVLEDLLL
jgi:hypothetical protein